MSDSPSASVHEVSAARPEYVALPVRGGDPVCGLSRSWWYGAERDGRIKLTRLRQPGCTRGRVLLPVRAALALIEKMSADEGRAESAA